MRSPCSKMGATSTTQNVSEVTMDDLVKLMIGRDLQDVYPKRIADSPARCCWRSTTSPGPSSCTMSPSNCTPARSSALPALPAQGAPRWPARSLAPIRTPARCRYPGKPYKPRSPQDAIHHGVALVTEDRKAPGTLPQAERHDQHHDLGLEAVVPVGRDQAGPRKSIWSRR